MLLGLLLFPFMLVFIRGDRKVERGIKIKRLWSSILCFFGGYRIDVKFEVDLPQDKPFIFCPNHTSYLDIVLMYLILPHQIAFLGMSEILKWPIINLFFKRGVDIPVYREAGKKAIDCLKPAADELKNGRSLVIFPEGKIPGEVPKLAPFKRGAFILAKENDTPIVPITFFNNWKLFSDHTDLFGTAKPGTAIVKVHQPIYPKDFQDFLSLQRETYRIIDTELQDYGNK